MAACTDTSRAEVGSSQTTTRESPAKARAMATRCLRPPESWYGPEGQMALLHPDGVDELYEPLLKLVAREAAELGKGPRDESADAVPAVEGRVGILEDDPQRLQLLRGPVLRREGECGLVELDDGARIGGVQAEENPGECRLPAAGLTHQSERLTGEQFEVDVDESFEILVS